MDENQIFCVIWQQNAYLHLNAQVISKFIMYKDLLFFGYKITMFYTESLPPPFFKQLTLQIRFRLCSSFLVSIYLSNLTLQLRSEEKN